MARRLASRSRVVRRPSLRPSPSPLASLEFLENRRLLSVAPVAVDDSYDLGPDGRLSVDVPATGAVPSFDESRFVEPTGFPATPTSTRAVEGGHVVTEPDWYEVADQPGTYEQVLVRDPGSRWVVTNWLEVGERGRGDVSVSNGGAVNVRNWTAVAANAGGGGTGMGTVTVTGPGSTWTSNNWMEIGYRNGWGVVRLLDHAAMTVNGSPNTASSGFVVVGDNENGNGLLEILDGSTFRHNDWIEVGDNSARGLVNVVGGGLLATTNFAAIGDNHGLGTVNVTGANSRWTVGNWMEVGVNGARGVLNIADGGSVTVNNWVVVGTDGSDGRILVGDGSVFSYRQSLTLGQGTAGTARGTLYVAEGGRVTGPQVLNAAGGSVLGNGTIASPVTNGGFLSPGGSVGLLTIAGSFNQPAAGIGLKPTTQFDIGGTERGTGYDALDVSGTATIAGGTVLLNFVNGFAPKSGDRFTLIDAASMTAAAPQTVEVRGLAAGFTYTLTTENGDLVLTATSDGTSAPVTVQHKGVLANDTDADGDALTAILVKRPGHGAVTLNRDGSFSYVAHPDFAGTDTFQYRADDGVFESNVATVTIHGPQQPPNDPPVAVNDTYNREGPGPVTVDAANGVLKNDTDDGRPPGSHLTAVLLKGPERGTLTLNPDGSFAYTPRGPNPFGDSFTYAAFDGQLQSAAATVRIVFQQPNHPPVANPDFKSVRENQTLTFPATELTANDTDPDPRTTLTVGAVNATGDTHGAVSLAGGQVTYVPEHDYSGPASFTYTVTDGRGGTATGVVHVTVVPRQNGTPGTAVGRGTLNDRRQSFAFTVVSRPLGNKGDDLSVMGMLNFEDKSAQLVFRSTDITSFQIDGGGKKVTFAGTATVNGRRGYRFEATAEDKGATGSNDRFRLKITGPDGYKYDSQARGNDKIDRGGNISIMSRKRPAGDGVLV